MVIRWSQPQAAESDPTHPTVRPTVGRPGPSYTLAGVARHQDDEAAAQDPAVDVEPLGDPERSGPLVLQRYAKADGRTLIIFRRAEPFDDGPREPA